MVCKIRMKIVMVVRRAVGTVKTTNPTTLEDSDAKATRSLGIAGTENTADVRLGWIMDWKKLV
jgi:hypothetical protein